MVAQEVVMVYGDGVSVRGIAMELMSRLRNTGSVILSAIDESIGKTAISRVSFCFIFIAISGVFVPLVLCFFLRYLINRKLKKVMEQQSEYILLVNRETFHSMTSSINDVMEAHKKRAQAIEEREHKMKDDWITQQQEFKQEFTKLESSQLEQQKQIDKKTQAILNSKEMLRYHDELSKGILISAISSLSSVSDTLEHRLMQVRVEHNKLLQQNKMLGDLLTNKKTLEEMQKNINTNQSRQARFKMRGALLTNNKRLDKMQKNIDTNSINQDKLSVL